MSEPIEWTEEALALLRSMRDERRTFTEIAAAFGCSRGVIAGKVRRLGLSGPRANPVGPVPAWKRARAARLLAEGRSVTSVAREMRMGNRTIQRIEEDRQMAIAATLSIVAHAAEDDDDDDMDFDDTPLPPRRLDSATGPGDGVGMATITNRECAWPLWGNERPTFRCCGAPVTEGRPYCAAHAKRAYSKQYSVPAREWTITEIDRCTGLYLQGMPVPKIAALIGRSSTEIVDKMRALSVRFGSGHMPRRVA